MILNSKEYVPRKLSAVEDAKQGSIRKDSLSYSKFDLNEPQYPNPRGSAYINNKFDTVNDQETFKQLNEKRLKSYSIHENYHQPHSFVPLNKNYDLDNARSESSKIRLFNFSSRIQILTE